MIEYQNKIYKLDKQIRELKLQLTKSNERAFVAEQTARKMNELYQQILKENEMLKTFLQDKDD